MQQFGVEFWWGRDPERRFKTRTIDGKRVVATDVRGDRFPKYNPLAAAEARSMLIAFANVADESSALEFVNLYGPLTQDGIKARKGDPVSKILAGAGLVRNLLDLVADSALDRKPEPDQTIDALPEGERKEARRKLARDKLADALNDADDFGMLVLRLVPALDPKDSPRLLLTPPDLYGALLYLLAEKLANGAVYKRCPYCKDVFEVGKEAGHTLKTRFCSVEHRTRYNSLNRSKGDQP